MRLRRQYLTQNDCYKSGRPLDARGIMLHSSGANNPRVSRYIPGTLEIGWNAGGNHWDRPGLEKCVHAFVGKFADGQVGTVQTLPWTMQSWHCGGYANKTHIGIEICEDGLTDSAYFAAVYREAAEAAAMLCKEFGLDPMMRGVILCHAEGYEMGWASNHGDVLHWWPMHGKTMDDFRADVARIMEEETMTEARIREIIRDELQKIETERADLNASPWAVTLLETAKAKGITDGSRPQSYATRQEVAIMVNAVK